MYSCNVFPIAYVKFSMLGCHINDRYGLCYVIGYDTKNRIPFSLKLNIIPIEDVVWNHAIWHDSDNKRDVSWHINWLVLWIINHENQFNAQYQYDYRSNVRQLLSGTESYLYGLFQMF